MTVIGIDLNVVGEENLTAKRPAVFIFNHRNQADPFIAGRLISDNFTSVGKKELENDPLMGSIGKVMDAAFIDRDDPRAAVEGLRKIEELARKGISVMIAPEGTRLDTNEVGTFKKGAFRIAMSAGIPIVPIIIRNAEVIAHRNSSTFNPGTVDVAVFPPIPVDDWTPDNLSERIAEVRQLYLDTLREWPFDGIPDVPLYSRSTAEKGPARNKTPAKKAPAKKAPAKKAPAKKTPAKKAPAKKVSAEKAEAGKAKPEKSTAATDSTASAKGRP
jgi:putative phosphoserine phosphatase/1-acylglycerol-3-phosphate O-acyltransferase